MMNIEWWYLSVNFLAVHGFVAYCCSGSTKSRLQSTSNCYQVQELYGGQVDQCASVGAAILEQDCHV